MMRKKSFWKIPLKALLTAALAFSMALAFTSCGNNGDTGPAATNAALVSRTLTGNVYEFDALTGDLVSFTPGTPITGITSFDYLPGITGEININGVFTFELPQTVPAALLEPLLDFFPLDELELSNPASAFIVFDFEVETIPGLFQLLWRGNVTQTGWTDVMFIYLNNATTLTLHEAESFVDGVITVTINPFRMNMQAGWNAVQSSVVEGINTQRVTLSGGNAGRWILD